VIRAAAAGERVARTTTIVIAGVGTTPVVGPVMVASTLRVKAELRRSPSASLLTRLQSSLGGRTRRVLKLELTNDSSIPLNGITATAALARSQQGGEPLQLPTLDAIRPGQTRSYEIAVSLPPPSFGSYVVYGTIYGSGTPIAFAVEMRTAPWALFLVAILMLADLVAIGILRLRRRRDRPVTLRLSHDKTSTKQTEVEQTSRVAFAADRASMVGGDALFTGGTGRADAE
jgi:hypothetical protein